MPQYRLARDITLKKGAKLQTPGELPKGPIQYAHASMTPDKLDGLAFVSIPFDEAMRAGLIEEDE